MIYDQFEEPFPMRFFQAIGLFFKVLFDGSFAEQAKQLASTPANAQLPSPDADTSGAGLVDASGSKAAGRSDAITLLATLQREARFIDIVQESIDGYSDEQVGAAARDVLNDCRKVLERMFSVTPATAAEEGSEVETPAKFDASEFRLTGNVTGEAPFKGSLVHHGWKATRCELPTWNGSSGAELNLAPVELELS